MEDLSSGTFFFKTPIIFYFKDKKEPLAAVLVNLGSPCWLCYKYEIVSVRFGLPRTGIVGVGGGHGVIIIKISVLNGSIMLHFLFEQKGLSLTMKLIVVHSMTRSHLFSKKAVNPKLHF